MIWRSLQWNGHTQWGLFDGEIELGRIMWYEPKRFWIWTIFDRDDMDEGIEGQELTLFRAGLALLREMKKPTHPITLANVKK